MKTKLRFKPAANCFETLYLDTCFEGTRKTRFLGLAVIFAVFALAFVSFDTSGEGLREKEFAARFTDTKLTAQESTGSYNLDPNHSYIGFNVSEKISINKKNSAWVTNLSTFTLAEFWGLASL